MTANRIFRQILLVSASAFLASVPAFACFGVCTCESQDQAIAEISAVEGQGTYSQTSASIWQRVGEQEFLREALEDSAGKVLLGQLAQQKSQSDDIKQFGQKLVQDNTQLREQIIERVAKLLGVEVPKGLSRKDKQLAANFEKLTGPQFDVEYIQAVLKDHKQDLKKFSDEVQLAQDPIVKIAAEQGTKVISQHLDLIEQIAENHNLAAQNHTVAMETK